MEATHRTCAGHNIDLDAIQYISNLHFGSMIGAYKIRLKPDDMLIEVSGNDKDTVFKDHTALTEKWVKYKEWKKEVVDWQIRKINEIQSYALNITKSFTGIPQAGSAKPDQQKEEQKTAETWYEKERSRLKSFDKIAEELSNAIGEGLAGFRKKALYNPDKFKPEQHPGGQVVGTDKKTTVYYKPGNDEHRDIVNKTVNELIAYIDKTSIIASGQILVDGDNINFDIKYKIKPEEQPQRYWHGVEKSAVLQKLSFFGGSNSSSRLTEISDNGIKGTMRVDTGTKLLRIRYNTDAKPEDKLKWRVVSENWEEKLAENVLIKGGNVIVATTHDLLPTGAIKGHITVYYNKLRWDNDKLTVE